MSAHVNNSSSDAALGSAPAAVLHAPVTRAARRRTEPQGDRPDPLPQQPWAPLQAIWEVAVVVMCVGLALIPILPTFASDGALYTVIVGVVMGALPILLGGFLRWPAPLTIVAAVATYVVVGSAVTVNELVIFGVVPTGAAMSEVLVGAVTSWKDLLTLETPLGTEQGTLILPFLVAFLGSAAVTGLVVWRRNWLSTIGVIVCVAAVLAIGVLWGPTEANLATGLGIFLATALALWAAWRMGQWRARRWPGLIVLLTVAGIGVGLLTPPLLADNQRFVLRSVVVPPFDPTAQISPLSKYRLYVKDLADTELLTITGLPESGMVRLATMDDFDGVVWNVSDTGSTKGSAAFRRISDSVALSPLEQAGEKYLVQVVIGELTGVWVPTVGSLQSMLFDTSTTDTVDFRFNDLTNTGVAIAGVNPGMRYRTIGALTQQPTDLELGSAEPDKALVPTQSQVPDIVRDRALQITKDATTPALVARDLEQYFQSSGYFSHGEQSGGARSLSGHGSDRIIALLTEDLMIGDAEQYASAMALMARELGLPARVVMGFGPQEQDPESAVTLTGSDMTAWVEINYGGHGWVSYFPTPDSSRTPQDSDQPSEVEPQPQTNQTPPDPPAPITPPQVDSEETNITSEQEEVPTGINWGVIFKVAAAVGIPVLFLTIWPLMIIWAKWRRRRNRQRGTPAAQITGGWQEILDVSRDLGKQPGADLTRRQTARFLAPDNHEPLTQLAEIADNAVFAGATPGVDSATRFWDLTGQVIRDLRTAENKRTRLRAKISWRSLRKTRVKRRAKKK